ncbi:MAG: radical SAM protein [Fibrobacter sp.]|nr:radical SAM protein [Fibrobacter sp.]
MDFKPEAAVWNITMRCNMHCKNCGSACTSAYSDELATNEAFRLCDKIGSMGFSSITLSGGEPTTHPDWDLIALRLHVNNVMPNLISNGWFIDGSVAQRAARANINTITICIEGLEETHDEIRMPGSFERIMNAFTEIKKTPVHLSASTTIHSGNIRQLPELLRILENNGVEVWKLQLDLPMGTMAENHDLVADPSCMDAIIALVNLYYKKTTVDIQFSDCIGYYNVKEIEDRQKKNHTTLYEWNECGAVKTSMRILHNGEILKCTP